MEDHTFYHWSARYLDTLAPHQFWTLNLEAARPSFAEVFGPDLEVAGHTLALAPGRGIASLGALVPVRQPHLAIEYGHNPRLLVPDGGRDLSLPITDVRLFEDDQRTVRVQWSRTSTGGCWRG